MLQYAKPNDINQRLKTFFYKALDSKYFQLQGFRSLLTQLYSIRAAVDQM